MFWDRCTIAIGSDSHHAPGANLGNGVMARDYRIATFLQVLPCNQNTLKKFDVTLATFGMFAGRVCCDRLASELTVPADAIIMAELVIQHRI
jgi:hypothetical protein